MRKWYISLARRGALRVVPPLGGALLGRDPDAIWRPLAFAFIGLEGPDPAVWDGPIFIHIPKAAGSSILSTGVKWTRGHQPYAFYARHKPADVAMPFTFSVVRHPLSRYISAFYYLKAGGGNAHDAFWARRHIPPGADHNAFCEVLQDNPRLLRQMHFRPQFEMLDDGSGRIGPDCSLRFETLADQWPAFAGAHGLERDLPHANRGGSRDRPDTTRRCREAIASIYRKDFEVLGYTMEA